MPYAVLWGCLAALLRFIPYVGPAVAFVLPLVFSFAHFPGWAQPLEVVALFAVVEAALNSFLEPVIYGKTTGVSALGLLVAAMFWTWLWGTLGLLLSTPLTVCLAVLGKYVPSLRFFATLLGEEAELEPDVRFYQRLVALDRDGAVEVVEAALKQRPRVEVFDEVLVPALSRAERDAARDELEEAEQAFVWQVVGEVLDGLEGVPDSSLASAGRPGQRGAGSRSTGASAPSPVLSLVGLAVAGHRRRPGPADARPAPGPVGLHPGDPHGHRIAVAGRRAGGRALPQARGRLAPAPRGADDRPVPGPTAAGPVRRLADRGGPLGRKWFRSSRGGAAGGKRSHSRRLHARRGTRSGPRLVQPSNQQEEVGFPVAG